MKKLERKLSPSEFENLSVEELAQLYYENGVGNKSLLENYSVPNNLEVAKRMGSRIYRPMLSLIKASAKSMTMIPTFTRQLGESAKGYHDGLIEMAYRTSLLSAISYFTFFVSEREVNPDTPFFKTVVSVGISTNIISGLYEWFRLEKRKIREDKN